MTNKIDKPIGIIIAGVGGQGTLTLAQLVIGAAWKSGLYCLQSEVHGMSQRGGAVNAHVTMDSKAVSSPLLLEGSADLLIGMEPLETLRYLNYVNKAGVVISSTSPIKNIPNYPEDASVIDEVNKIDGVKSVDTDEHSKTLKNKHAGNIILLGMASAHLPIEDKIWFQIFEERFATKGEKVIQKNIEAFNFGKNLVN